MTIEALSTSINLSPSVASVFATVALTANPDQSDDGAPPHFDLDHLNKHGVIEHDVSLSRQDVSLGDNHSFDEWVWDRYLESYGQASTTSMESASRARMDRVLAAKAGHDAANMPFGYGIKELIMSYGETALFLAMLGDPENGKIPIEHLKILFGNIYMTLLSDQKQRAEWVTYFPAEQERLPFNEGWRPPQETITQSHMNHLIFSLVKANEKKAEEAHLVGLGTVNAVTAAVTNMLPNHCTIM
jgi:hypothetical protein